MSENLTIEFKPYVSVITITVTTTAAKNGTGKKAKAVIEHDGEELLVVEEKVGGNNAPRVLVERTLTAVLGKYF